MRASATSRISSAHIPAAQNKPDANKADDASPFAMLMAATSSKDAGKAAQKDARSSDDKPQDEKAVKSADKKDNKADAGQAQTETRAAPKPSAEKSGKAETMDKSEKTDKPEKTGKSEAGTGDDKTVQAASLDDALKTLETAPAQPPVDPQSQPLLPQTVQAAPPPASAPAPANDDADEDEIAAASGVQNSQAPKTAPPVQNNVPVATPAQGAAPAQDAPPAQDQGKAQAETVQAAATPAPQDPSKDISKDAPTEQAPAAQSASKPAPASTSKPLTASAGTKGNDKIDGVKAAKPGHDSAAANKTDTQASAKADANATVTEKPAAAESAPAPRETPAPHQAAVDANSITVSPLAAPQAQQPGQSAVPTVTQHVQVTAQPAPNVPALAVEIAAKSQSGAKQFDIRLDPPELGRVEVRLSIDATGKASAHLSADQPQTLDLLQKDAPALARALRDAGLDVSQDGLNFSLRHQGGGQDGHASNGGNRGMGRSFNLSASTSIDATATSAAYRSVADGRLDIRV